MADNWETVARAAELARRGEDCALATVVWRQGPSSGQQGSRAVVTADGEIFGWIGGACAEPTVIREAQAAIADGEPRLLLLGAPEQFGHVPEGMAVIPLTCQSEGALEVYIEPVVSTPHLVVVGRSPMSHTLRDLAQVLGWRAEVVDGPDFSSAEVDARAVVVVATQGHGDEDAVEHAVTASPAYVGLVASRKRGEAVLEYLTGRGVPQHLLDRVRVPVGLDLGHTTHTEIAVSVLAELVQLRASGAFAPHRDAAATQPVATAIDPVCGMTVTVSPSALQLEHAGVTYYFCGVGCRSAFERDPASYLDKEARC
jgi:xanthine dehydrogenase accessory factor